MALSSLTQSHSSKTVLLFQSTLYVRKIGYKAKSFWTTHFVYRERYLYAVMGGFMTEIQNSDNVFRKYVAELLGTFALVFFGCGSAFFDYTPEKVKQDEDCL